MHTGRQGLADLGEPRFDAVRDLAAVGALQEHGDSHHRLPPSVARGRSISDLGAEVDSAQVTHENRAAVPGRDDDALDVLQRLDQAYSPQQPPLALLDQVGAAGVGVVALQGLDDVVEGQAVCLQLFGIDLHLVLLLTATEAVDVDDPRHRAELGLDDPVEEAAKLHRRDAGGHGAVRFHRELVNLAKARADGRQLGLHARRQLLAGDQQTLQDQLARPVDVDVLLEGDRHLGQAELRDGAHPDLAGQAADGHFDGEGHVLLHLFGGEPGGQAVDLHLVRRDVGHCVHWQIHSRGHTKGGGHQCQ